MSNPWVLQMVWKHICFCHWRISQDLLAPYVPFGWQLDTYENEAWISVVPFAMADVRARYLPAIPGFHNVPEINLRTYVRRGDLRAVFFFSLDAHSRLLVEAARLTTGLPYRLAIIALAEIGGGISYISERVDTREADGNFSAVYTPQGIARVAAAGSIEEFLHERYHFVTVGGLVGQVLHEPYRVQGAGIRIERNTLPAIIGQTLPNQPELCYYAERLHVRAAYAGANLAYSLALRILLVV